MSDNTQHFDDRAQTWDQDKTKIERAETVSKLIRERLDGYSKKTALEYGCGTGLLSQALAKDFEHIILADTSDGMLNVLREKIALANYEHFEPRNLDLISDLHFPPATIDVLYSLMTLHHIPETEKILNRFADVLSDGGILFIADLEKEDGTFHPAGTEGIHYGFDRQELTKITKAAGFTAIQFIDAFCIKKVVEGIEKEFPVFLMMAKKQHQ